MLAKVNPTETAAWSELQRHHARIAPLHLREMFAGDPERFTRFSLRFEDLLVDFAKHRITEETVDLLLNLAGEAGLEQARAAMFRGERINETEGRAVLHTALRHGGGDPVLAEGRDVMPDVVKVRRRMREIATAVLDGAWRGYTGRAVTDVVNIGIGGSDLGPVMVTEALKPYWRPRIQPHFVSNVDGTDLAETLKRLDPETTLFIVSSKTFTTQETMLNAGAARRWFLAAAGDESRIGRHFIAVSTNAAKVAEFGIDPENMLEFWDWVGGRYSLWSAIGLIIACTIGYDQFERLLDGAAAMDRHFLESAWRVNIPVILALLGIWYGDFFGAETHAVLPYDQYLRRFPAYLQQAEMESNGKSVDRSGREVAYQTGPVIFGEPGTNGQHSFYQLIHQGTKLVPCDFLAPAQAQNPLPAAGAAGLTHHDVLLANFLAQTEALMLGRTREEAAGMLRRRGVDAAEAERLAPYMTFPGNRPSTSILYKRLTPRTLGSLIALYEHKIFVQGVIWNIYSFDQFGVELGKQLAQRIQPELAGAGKAANHDASTSGLIEAYKEWREE